MSINTEKKFNPTDPWIQFPPAVNSQKAEPRYFQFSYLELNPDIMSSLLSSAKNGGGEVLCLCNRADPQKLSVGKRKGYYLSCYPNTRFHHHMDCPFFGIEAEQSALTSYAKEAFAEEDGLIDVALDEPMFNTKRVKKEPIKLISEGGDSKLSQMSVKGLLHLLYEEAGLNIWKPSWKKHRGYTKVRRRLFAAASRIAVNEQLLKDNIYIPPQIFPNSSEEYIKNAMEGKKKYLKKCIGDSNRIFFYGGIVKGCYRKKKKNNNDPYYVVTFKNDNTPIFVHPDTMKEINRSLNNTSLTELCKQKKTVFLLLRTNIVNKQYYWAKGGAGTLITSSHIPVQNTVELKMAEKLIQNQRYFVKPLLFDAEGLKLLSDFILLDTDKDPCHIYVNHVLGNIDYQRRKFQARESLEKLHKSSVFWEEGDTFPELPEHKLKSVS